MPKNKMTHQEAAEATKNAFALLTEVTKSELHAFSSRTPSGTDTAIRRNITHAKTLLDISVSLLRG